MITSGFERIGVILLVGAEEVQHHHPGGDVNDGVEAVEVHVNEAMRLWGIDEGNMDVVRECVVIINSNKTQYN